MKQASDSYYPVLGGIHLPPHAAACSLPTHCCRWSKFNEASLLRGSDAAGRLAEPLTGTEAAAGAAAWGGACPHCGGGRAPSRGRGRPPSDPPATPRGHPCGGCAPSPEPPVGSWGTLDTLGAVGMWITAEMGRAGLMPWKGTSANDNVWILRSDSIKAYADHNDCTFGPISEHRY